MPPPLTDADLQRLVNAFYAKVRGDALLGPVFGAAVANWPEHLEKLGAFWSSVMRTTGRYKGSPMGAHLRHADAIRPEHAVELLRLLGGGGMGDLAGLGRARLAILPGTTHFMPPGSGILDRSDWLLPMISDFLASASDAPSAP